MTNPLLIVKETLAYHRLNTKLIIAIHSGLGLGELCSKTVLLCYAPMLSNALIMLIRIVIMLTVCSLYNMIHEHVVTCGKLPRVTKKNCSACSGPMKDCYVVDSTVESVKSEFWMLFWPIMLMNVSSLV